jgi:hypothetical protein
MMGVAGVLCLAAGLLLVGDERPGTAVAASLLTVPAGAGLVAGTVGTGLGLTGAFFPTQTTTQLSARSLLLVARVGITAGCMLAVLGVALGARTYDRLALGTGVVPVAASVVLAAVAILSGSGPGGAGRLLSELAAWVVSPAPIRTHLASLCVLVSLAALATGAALEALPVAELVADAGGGETADRRVDRTASALDWLAAAGFAGALLGLVVELPVDPQQLRRLVGPARYRVLVSLSTAPAPRLVCVTLLAVSLPALVTATLLQGILRSARDDLARRGGPVLAGGILTVVALAASGPVLDALLPWVASKLPGPLGRQFADAAGGVVVSVGPGAVGVVLAAGLVAVAAGAVLFVRLLLASGYVAESTVGYSLASGGLFLAAASAGAAGLSRPVAFGGLVAALLVWDLGRYGTVLGREVGQGTSTRTPELLHAGGSLAVGLVAVLLAVGLGSATTAAVPGGSRLSALALLGVVAGIVLLVEALR